MRTAKREWIEALRRLTGNDDNIHFNELVHRWEFTLAGADGVPRNATGSSSSSAYTLAVRRVREWWYGPSDVGRVGVADGRDYPVSLAVASQPRCDYAGYRAQVL